MDIVQIARAINITLALSSMPFSIYLLIHVVRSAIPNSDVKAINKGLRLLFTATSLIGLYSGVLSLLLFLEVDLSRLGDYGQLLFNGRNLVVNATIFFVNAYFTLVILRKSNK